MSDSDQPVSASLTGLAPGTTYHYRVVAVNAAGTARGADQSFTTTGMPPADPGTGTGGTGTGGTGTSSGGTGANPQAATVGLTLAKRYKLKITLSRGFSFKATCSSACRVQAELTLAGKAAKKLKLSKGKPVVGKAPVSCPRAVAP